VRGHGYNREFRARFYGREKAASGFPHNAGGLVNVEKHAKAAKVTVMYHRDEDGSIHAGVFDDGLGFTPPGDAVYNSAMPN